MIVPLAEGGRLGGVFGRRLVTESLDDQCQLE